MYKILAVASWALLALPVMANSPVNQFYWLEGQANIPSIDLNAVPKSTPDLTWTYAVDCRQQTIESDNDDGAKTDTQTDPNAKPKIIFKCALEDSNLTTELVPDTAGSGTIKVAAIGRDTSGAVVKTDEFYYTVQVIPEPKVNLNDCIRWDCAIYTAFYLGYEGTSVSQVNQKGNLRMQYTGYSQIDSVDIHIYGGLMQTSLQEQAAAEESCTAEDSAAENCDIETTIAADIGIFRPFDVGDIGLNIGPMLEYNLQKLDTTDAFAKSYYGGLRFAYSKIRFFSIGYGKSEGIPGERVKFIGQLPIYDEKLIAGMVLNASVDNTAKDKGVSPGDSIHVYVMTRVDFTKIFTNFTQ